MKMLTTQITGLLQRIASSEEEAIGMTARLLAQATTGQGKVYFAAFGELGAVSANAIRGAEPFKGAVRYRGEDMTSADRVWILTRSASDEEALALARRLSEQFIPFAALASEAEDAEGNELADLAHAYVSLGVRKGLLPDDEGGRTVLPHALAGLFIYEAVRLDYVELLTEFD
ncbi:DUF2529 family protein [Bhargavaea ullalensis]|uniref:DUF2529 domain-containing protein n=1 Tax=Bhargavaea ullalensis TaxID=1265685 RepID=A0ABV2GBU9_9BACL